STATSVNTDSTVCQASLGVNRPTMSQKETNDATRLIKLKLAKQSTHSARYQPQFVPIVSVSSNTDSAKQTTRMSSTPQGYSVRRDGVLAHPTFRLSLRVPRSVARQPLTSRQPKHAAM